MERAFRWIFAVLIALGLISAHMSIAAENSASAQRQLRGFFDIVA